MDFRALWSTFRKTVYFRISYLVLVSLMAALLAPTALGCLSLLLVPVLMFLVPYSFGERSMRNHAVNGVFIILLTTVLYAAIATPDLVSRSQAPQSATSGLTSIQDGIVTPFRGPENTNFNFTVRVTSSDTAAGTFSVQLQVIHVQPFGAVQRLYRMVPGDDSVLSNGENFSYETTLPADFHLFNFRVLKPVNLTEEIVAQTFGSAGPFNAPFGSYLYLVWARFVVVMLVTGLGFYLLLLVYWWTRKAREVRGPAIAEAKRKRAEGGGEFTCTNCGADVAESDAKCPKCGAEFESEAPSEPSGAKA